MRVNRRPSVYGELLQSLRRDHAQHHAEGARAVEPGRGFGDGLTPRADHLQAQGLLIDRQVRLSRFERGARVIQILAAARQFYGAHVGQLTSTTVGAVLGRLSAVACA